MTPLLAAALGILHHRRHCRPALGGEARFTRDVDVTLLTGFGTEREFIETILESGFRGRISAAAGCSLKYRVLMLDNSLPQGRER